MPKKTKLSRAEIKARLAIKNEKQKAMRENHALIQVKVSHEVKDRLLAQLKNDGLTYKDLFYDAIEAYLGERPVEPEEKVVVSRLEPDLSDLEPFPRIVDEHTGYAIETVSKEELAKKYPEPKPETTTDVDLSDLEAYE